MSLKQVVERYKVLNYIHNGVYTGSGEPNAVWMRDHANDNGRKIATRVVTHDDIVKSPQMSGVTDSVIDPVDCPGADPQLRILHGPYETNPGWTKKAFEEGNNKGIVLRIDYGKSSFLFLGDPEPEAMEPMGQFHSGTDALKVDVFLASHHGSDNGTTPAEMKALSPQIGVISMGPAERKGEWTAYQYGHPRKVAVDLIAEAVNRSRAKPKDVFVATGQFTFVKTHMTKAIYATGWDGTVVVEADQRRAHRGQGRRSYCDGGSIGRHDAGDCKS